MGGLSFTTHLYDFRQTKMSGQEIQQIVSRSEQHGIQSSHGLGWSLPLDSAEDNHEERQQQLVLVLNTPSNNDQDSQRCAEKIKASQDKLHACQLPSTTVQPQSVLISQKSHDQHDLGEATLAISEDGELNTTIRSHVQYEQEKIAAAEHFGSNTYNHLFGGRELDSGLKQNSIDTMLGGGLGGIEDDGDFKAFVHEAKFLPGRVGLVPDQEADVKEVVRYADL